MNLNFKLVLVERGEKASLYSVILEGEKESEFDKFLIDPQISGYEKFDELLAQLDEIINRYGCQERFFRNESSIFDSVAALPRGDLRLYCCRYGNIILIVGSGGIKKTRTYQEDPALDQAVQIMAEVSRRVDEKIRNREIQYSGNSFKGDLNFRIEE